MIYFDLEDEKEVLGWVNAVFDTECPKYATELKSKKKITLKSLYDFKNNLHYIYLLCGSLGIITDERVAVKFLSPIYAADFISEQAVRSGVFQYFEYPKGKLPNGNNDNRDNRNAAITIEQNADEVEPPLTISYDYSAEIEAIKRNTIRNDNNSCSNKINNGDEALSIKNNDNSFVVATANISDNSKEPNFTSTSQHSASNNEYSAGDNSVSSNTCKNQRQYNNNPSPSSVVHLVSPSYTGRITANNSGVANINYRQQSVKNSLKSFFESSNIYEMDWTRTLVEDLVAGLRSTDDEEYLNTIYFFIRKLMAFDRRTSQNINHAENFFTPSCINEIVDRTKPDFLRNESGNVPNLTINDHAYEEECSDYQNSNKNMGMMLESQYQQSLVEAEQQKEKENVNTDVRHLTFNSEPSINYTTISEQQPVNEYAALGSIKARIYKKIYRQGTNNNGGNSPFLPILDGDYQEKKERNVFHYQPEEKLELDGNRNKTLPVSYVINKDDRFYSFISSILEKQNNLAVNTNKTMETFLVMMMANLKAAGPGAFDQRRILQNAIKKEEQNKANRLACLIFLYFLIFVLIILVATLLFRKIS